MPTLNASFRLFDGYSKTIGQVITGTDRATNRMIQASGATDKFNGRLNKMSSGAGMASNALGKLVGTIGAYLGIKKAIDITDSYTNTSARLALINDGLQTQEELQDKIFASAMRSRGAYGDMANSIAKMGMLAADAFGNNDELIAFTELMQKSFKLSGSNTAEQQSAMLQLSQAMASGRLQGDEFRSLSETSPMLLQAIAKYTGKTRGELKEMSSDGAITADIIKNAMFGMSDEINDNFQKLPATFGDIWNKISNASLKAFSPLLQTISGMVNSDGFTTFLNGVAGALNVVAQSVLWVVNTIINGWDFIGPILAAIATVLLVYMIIQLWAMIPPLYAVAAGWLMINWPILIVIGAIALMVYLMQQSGVTMQQVAEVIGGSIGVLIQLFINMGTAITNTFIGIAKIIDTVITGAINLVLKGVNAIITALNKIPGVNIGSVSEFQGLTGGLKFQEYGSLTDAYNNGASKGADFYNGASDKLKGLSDFMSGGDTPPGMPGLDKPVAVTGDGKSGAVKVDVAKEDLKYLKDIADREYINKFSTATLAPNTTVMFTGPISKDVDTDKMYKRIGKIMKEQIAIVAEG